MCWELDILLQNYRCLVEYRVLESPGLEGVEFLKREGETSIALC